MIDGLHEMKFILVKSTTNTPTRENVTCMTITILLAEKNYTSQFSGTVQLCQMFVMHWGQEYNLLWLTYFIIKGKQYS